MIIEPGVATRARPWAEGAGMISGQGGMPEGRHRAAVVLTTTVVVLLSGACGGGAPAPKATPHGTSTWIAENLPPGTNAFNGVSCPTVDHCWVVGTSSSGGG